jgi:predicted transcriptional regulator
LGWISLPQLCRLLGAGRQSVKDNIVTELTELVNDGLVERSGSGLYQITPKGAMAVTMETVDSMAKMLNQLKKIWEEG